VPRWCPGWILSGYRGTGTVTVRCPPPGTLPGAALIARFGRLPFRIGLLGSARGAAAITGPPAAAHRGARAAGGAATSPVPPPSTQFGAYAMERTRLLRRAFAGWQRYRHGHWPEPDPGCRKGRTMPPDDRCADPAGGFARLPDIHSWRPGHGRRRMSGNLFEQFSGRFRAARHGPRRIAGEIRCPICSAGAGPARRPANRIWPAAGAPRPADRRRPAGCRWQLWWDRRGAGAGTVRE
jgi:hypothetical protein